MCSRHIHFGMPPGMERFVGMPMEQFERDFSYPAPPMPVFAAQLEAWVPPPQPVMVFGQPGGAQPMVPPQPQAVAPQMLAAQMVPQPPMAVAQPMVAQPMAVAPPPATMMMTATATVPAGQAMQVQLPSGLVSITVPAGVEVGQSFQFQSAAPPPQAVPMAQPVPMAPPGYGANYAQAPPAM